MKIRNINYENPQIIHCFYFTELLKDDKDKDKKRAATQERH